MKKNQMEILKLKNTINEKKKVIISAEQIKQMKKMCELESRMDFWNYPSRRKEEQRIIKSEENLHDI